jgi:hypothetical protein
MTTCQKIPQAGATWRLTLAVVVTVCLDEFEQLCVAVDSAV